MKFLLLINLIVMMMIAGVIGACSTMASAVTSLETTTSVQATTTSSEATTTITQAPSPAGREHSPDRIYMLWTALSALQSRIAEYPGYRSLHSDAIKFHETATGEHDTAQFLVTQTWVTGEAFQSMIRDFDDIDRIRHELDLIPTTTTTGSEYITLTKNATATFNTRLPPAPPMITSGFGTGFSDVPFDHHSTHTAASSYVPPSSTAADAESGCSHHSVAVLFTKYWGFWILLLPIALSLFVFW